MRQNEVSEVVNTIVSTNYGDIQGVKEGECIVFKGVPYAKPPIGKLRFCAPQKPEKYQGVYQADSYPNRSAQQPWDSPDGFYKKEFYTDEIYETPISEDSLYLNIWIPKEYKNKKMPVLFYIHGGAFVGGTGHELEFRTDAYAKQDIILVTINYRLGIFGFLAHPWLEQEDRTACGNYGILDQIAALDWVRENIEYFGGDSENITICGQSAGAMSVETLLSSELADGKYHRAIIQSAGGYPNYILDMASLERAMKLGEYAMECGSVKSIEELRSISMEHLLEIQSQVMLKGFQKGNGLLFSPVVNGIVLKDTITGTLEKGQMYRVPTMIGCTRHDITVTPEEAEEENSRIHQSDVDYSIMNEQGQNNPAYVYYFRRSLPGDDAGAFHSGELWYTFGTLGSCWRPMTEADHSLSNEIISYWSNFIKTGNPNGAELEPWELCTKKEPNVKIFDIKS